MARQRRNRSGSGGEGRGWIVKRISQSGFRLANGIKRAPRFATMILKRIGHVLLRVADIERAKAFYCGILGFTVREQDLDHGGVFLGLEHSSHTIDLMQASDSRPSAHENNGPDDLSSRGAPGSRNGRLGST